MVNVVPSQDIPKTDWTCLQEITGSPPRPPSQQAPTALGQFEDQGEGWQDNRRNVWIIFLAQLFFFGGGGFARDLGVLFRCWIRFFPGIFLAFWTGLTLLLDMFEFCFFPGFLLSVTLENEADKNIEHFPFPYPQRTFLSYKVRCGSDIWACSWSYGGYL